MLEWEMLPPSLAGLLWAFRSCFTGPSFRTFAALVAGAVVAPGRRTVVGMFAAAGLAGVWHHSRAHWFFGRARWQPVQVSAVLTRLVIDRLLPAGAPVLIAVDDTLMRRSGRRVHAAGWHHDGAAGAPARASKPIAWGNCWVVAGIVVRLPMLSRPVCLPVAMALVTTTVTPGPARGRTRVRDATRVQASKQVLAGELVAAIHAVAQATHPGRAVHVVADCWYAGVDGAPGAAVGAARQRGLPDGVTLTSRLRGNAGLWAQAPTPVLAPGQRPPRGRRKQIGAKNGTPDDLARDVTRRRAWRRATVTRYGRTHTVEIADTTCLWYGVYRCRPVRVILIREPKTTHTSKTSKTSKTGFQIALVSTDLDSTAEDLIERYAARWSIEVAFEDAKQHTGVGQAQNRTPRAVERTVPFGMIVQRLTVLWYAEHGHHPDLITERRTQAPWYRTKTQPAYHDMITKLRRTLIAARFNPRSPAQPTPNEIHTIRLAWTQTAA